MSAIEDSRVAAVFGSYPSDMRNKLLFLRNLIFDVAESEGVGALEETLKWGEPSYLTQTKSGSTVRLAWKESQPNQYAMHFTCTTQLVATFKKRYPTQFNYVGNRSIVFNEEEDIPVSALKNCVAMALTYRRDKNR